MTIDFIFLSLQKGAKILSLFSPSRLAHNGSTWKCHPTWNGHPASDLRCVLLSTYITGGVPLLPFALLSLLPFLINYFKLMVCSSGVQYDSTHFYSIFLPCFQLYSITFSDQITLELLCFESFWYIWIGQNDKMKISTWFHWVSNDFWWSTMINQKLSRGCCCLQIWPTHMPITPSNNMMRVSLEWLCVLEVYVIKSGHPFWLFSMTSKGKFGLWRACVI